MCMSIAALCLFVCHLAAGCTLLRSYCVVECSCGDNFYMKNLIDASVIHYAERYLITAERQ